jgi:hypothetical protein
MESWQPLAAYLADMCSKPVGKVDIFVWECLPQCMCLWERAPSTMFFSTSHLHHLSVAPRVSRIHVKSPKRFGGWIVILEFYGVLGGRLYFIYIYTDGTNKNGKYTLWQSSMACRNVLHLVRTFYCQKKTCWILWVVRPPQWCLFAFKLYIR